jgi:hypothetical protein
MIYPKIRPLKDLPNSHGFAFIGVRHNGTSSKCHVFKLPCGTHEIRGEAKYSDLEGWLPCK